MKKKEKQEDRAQYARPFPLSRRESGAEAVLKELEDGVVAVVHEDEDGVWGIQ